MNHMPITWWGTEDTIGCENVIWVKQCKVLETKTSIQKKVYFNIRGFLKTNLISGVSFCCFTAFKNIQPHEFLFIMILFERQRRQFQLRPKSNAQCKKWVVDATFVQLPQKSSRQSWRSYTENNCGLDSNPETITFSNFPTDEYSKHEVY